MRIEHIDAHSAVARGIQRGGHQRVGGASVPCHNRADLIEQASLPAAAVLDNAGLAPHGVRVSRRRMERPLDYGTTGPAECASILLDDGVQVGGGERLHVAGIRARVPQPGI